VMKLSVTCDRSVVFSWNIIFASPYFQKCRVIALVRIMVFNATFSNISVISWLSVLLVEETGVPRENHRDDEFQDTEDGSDVIDEPSKMFCYTLIPFH
jgi:hypothetical protein